MRCVTTFGTRRGGEPVDRREERRERLARTGRRADQRVFTGDDARPPLDLRRRRLGERRREPLPNGRRERLEHRVMGDVPTVPRGCDGESRPAPTQPTVSAASSVRTPAHRWCRRADAPQRRRSRPGRHRCRRRTRTSPRPVRAPRPASTPSSITCAPPGSRTNDVPTSIRTPSSCSSIDIVPSAAIIGLVDRHVLGQRTRRADECHLVIGPVDDRGVHRDGRLTRRRLTDPRLLHRDRTRRVGRTVGPARRQRDDRADDAQHHADRSPG